MYKLFLSMLCVAVIFAACNQNPTTDNQASNSSQEETAVEEDIPIVSVGEFESIAAEYVDYAVNVRGIVDHVCKHGGKRILLVDDDADLHIDSEDRFDDELMGSEITVTGIVREFRVDEAYCLQMEEDNIQSHKEGSDNDSFEQNKEQIQSYRESMKEANTDHLSFYSLDYISHVEHQES